MEKRSEDALKYQMRELVKQHAALFEQAMVLRVDVHYTLAFEQGAEAEDIPDIIAGAIESAIPITTAFFNALSEVSKANAYSKRKGG